jgi:RHS repeat-associated protein
VQDKQGSNIVNYLNGLGIDDKLKVDNKYFLKDHLGSTIGLMNTSGSLVKSQKYEAFGKATGSLSTRYGYTGREYDSDTKLNYYRARWYDAEQGRFISSDPIGFYAGLNFYSYVRNKPTMYTDAWGLLDPGIYQYAQPITENAKYVGPAVVGAGSAAAASSGGVAGVAGMSVAAAPAAVVGAVVVGGLAVGYAIGYYPGQYIAQTLYPEQFPQTQTQRQPTTVTDGEACDANPNARPTPTPERPRTCTLSSTTPFGKGTTLLAPAPADYSARYCRYNCSDGMPCWTGATKLSLSVYSCAAAPTTISIPKGVDYIP